MKAKGLFGWVFVLAVAIAASASAAKLSSSVPKGWIEDFEAAKKEAAAGGKYILLAFSGSDWCGWCMKLDEEVFSKKEFVEGASKEYVLVLIDSPRDEAILSKKAKEQNPKLIEKYEIEGFPSVLVMDAEGNKLKQTGYRKGGAEGYLKHLAEIKTAISEFEAFKKEVGAFGKGSAERLGKIDAFLQKIGEEEAEDHEDLVKELLDNDKDGKFAAKYPHFAYVKPAEAKVSELFDTLNDEIRKRLSGLGHKPENDDIKKARKEVDAIAREKLPEVKKAIEAIKARAPKSAMEDLDDCLGTLARLEEQLNEKDDEKKEDK